MRQNSFDSVWENDIYGQGQHLNRYPYDSVVTFVFRHAPQNKPRGDVRILEVGCGAGNNLWFAAREGFCVAGVDASTSAINYARQRFREEDLNGEFKVGDFTELPWLDGLFDMVIDRTALTCCGWSAAQNAVTEIRRVLRQGGVFHFNPYHERHSSNASGELGGDGVRMGINHGSLKNVGQIYFYSRRNIEQLFSKGWTIRSMQSMEMTEEMHAYREVHAEWRVIVEKL